MVLASATNKRARSLLNLVDNAVDVFLIIYSNNKLFAANCDRELGLLFVRKVFAQNRTQKNCCDRGYKSHDIDDTKYFHRFISRTEK